MFHEKRSILHYSPCPHIELGQVLVSLPRTTFFQDSIVYVGGRRRSGRRGGDW